jgi:hypothetical protein
MQGNQTIPFSELFADTVRAHGIKWARQYYWSHGMPLREFSIWLSGMLNAK